MALKPVARTMTSTRALAAALQLDAVLLDAPDPVRDQGAIVTQQGVVHAVVRVDEHGPGRERWRDRQHLLHQLRMIGELPLHELDACVTGPLVHRAPRMRVLERRVGGEGSTQLLRAGQPTRPEPSEVLEVREVPIQPVHLRRVRRAVAGDVEAPVGGALEEVRVACHLGELRDHLVAGAPAADHRDPLAGEVQIARPAGGVEQRALERCQPFDVRQVRTGQEAHAADHRVGTPVPRPVGPDRCDLPDLGVLVPDHRLHFGLELDVARAPRTRRRSS